MIPKREILPITTNSFSLDTLSVCPDENRIQGRYSPPSYSVFGTCGLGIQRNGERTVCMNCWDVMTLIISFLTGRYGKHEF